MKFLKVLWIILAALCVLGCIIVFSYSLLSSDSFLNFITSNYQTTLKIDSGYSITYDSISTDRLNKLEIQNLLIEKESRAVLSTSELKISTSLIDFIRLALGSDNVSFVFDSVDLYADLHLSTISTSTNSVDNDEFVTDLLKRLNADLNIDNANISVSIDDFSFISKDIEFHFSINKNLSIQSLCLSTSSIDVFVLDKNAELKNVLIDVNSLDNIKISVSSFEFEGICFDTLNSDSCISDDIVMADINIKSIEYLDDYFYANSDDLDISFQYSFLDHIVSLTSSKLSINTDLYDLSNIVLSDLIASAQFRNNGKLSVASIINGSHTNTNIGDFGLNLNLSTSVYSFNDLIDPQNYYGLEAIISDFNCASFIGSNNFYISSENMNDFSSIFNISDKINGNVSYSFDSLDSNIRLYISSLRFSEYQTLFDIIEKYAGEFSDVDTQIDGSIVYKGKLDFNDLNGRVSVNLVGQNIIFANQKQTLATSIEANAENNNLLIDTLAITALGKRLSYSGDLNLNNYFPEGKLVLQDSKSYDEIAKIVFNLDENKLGYTFNADIAVVDNLNIDGHVNFSDKSLISAQTSINTEYYDYRFNFDFDVNNLVLTSTSDNSDILVSYKDKLISVLGSINSVPVYLSDTTIVHASAGINAFYNMNNLDFKCSFNDLLIKISDILELNFDLNVNNSDLSVSSLYIKYNESTFDFTGNLKAKYNNIEDLLKFDFNKINIVSDLHSIDTSNHIIGTYTEGFYALDLDLDLSKNLNINMLGSFDNGFYSECKFGDINFVIKFADGNVVIENANGKLNSLQLNNLNFNLDFMNRNVTCSFDLLNEMENYDSVLNQGGSFQLEAKLDSFVLGALNLAGIDAEASFKLMIYDAYLGDGFNLTDTSIDVTFSRSNVKLIGNLINGYILPQEKFIDINIDKDFLFGLHAKGYYDDRFEIYLSDIYFPLQLIDQFINTPFYTTYGGIIQGELLLNGSYSDPSFYGMLSSQAFNMGLLFIPDQKLSLKNVTISAVDHTFYITRIPVVGHSDIDGRYYDGNVSVELNLGALSLDSMDLYLDVFDKPIDLWIPLILDETNDLDIRGDVVGTLHFYYKDNIIGVDSEITADNGSVTFRIDDKPDWMVDTGAVINTNVLLTSGKNVEFYYPSKNNAFINFTVDEGNTVNILYDALTNETSAIGSFDIKSGRISYINNDFAITDGNCSFSKDLNGDFQFNIDLLANIREYDYDGNRMDIYLTLKNANLNNINPRFTSVPSLTENEILQVLASSVLPEKNEGVSFVNVANAAFVAARAVSNLGIVDSIKDHSLNSVVRNSLNLDIFTARSLIFENIILDSISYADEDVSLLAKYLNGTSIFAGKYFGNEWFARMTILLRSVSNKEMSNNYGHILTSDLNLDFEFSLEWDNPLCEFAIFTMPQELSVFDFLDTIGFSVTKRFSF